MSGGYGGYDLWDIFELFFGDDGSLFGGRCICVGVEMFLFYFVLWLLFYIR